MPTYGKVADDARDTVMAVLFDGDVRGKTGWDKKSPEYHVLRAIAHCVKFLQGDTTEAHIDNALTRLGMAKWKINSVKGLRDDEFKSEELDR